MNCGVGYGVGCVVAHDKIILTWHGRYPDQQGGSPRARPVHCTLGGLTPAIASNAGDSSV